MTHQEAACAIAGLSSGTVAVIMREKGFDGECTYSRTDKTVNEWLRALELIDVSKMENCMHVIERIYNLHV